MLQSYNISNPFAANYLPKQSRRWVLFLLRIVRICLVKNRLLNLFSTSRLCLREKKKVRMFPICPRRIFSLNNFTQWCCRILVFVLRRTNKVAKWKKGFNAGRNVLRWITHWPSKICQTLCKILYWQEFLWLHLIFLQQYLSLLDWNISINLDWRQELI